MVTIRQTPMSQKTARDRPRSGRVDLVHPCHEGQSGLAGIGLLPEGVGRMSPSLAWTSGPGEGDEDVTGPTPAVTSELATLRLEPAVHTHRVLDGKVARSPRSHFLDFVIDAPRAVRSPPR